MRQYLDITKALGDAGRVRALVSLAGGELCLCQIIGLLKLSPSTVSRHMAILQQARLVACRKDGRWRYYRLAGRDAPAVVREALRWTMASLRDDKTIRTDTRQLRGLRRRGRDPSAACYPVA